MKKLWILAPLAAAIFAFGCSGGGETAAKTDGGDEKPKTEATTGGEGGSSDSSSYVGNFKLDISKEMGELQTKIDEAKKKADGGDEAAKTELASLEMQKQMTEQMVGEMEVVITDDGKWTMNMGEQLGSVSGTYKADGNNLTLTPTDFSKMKGAEPTEADKKPQVLVYDPKDQTLAPEGQAPDQPKFKKV